MNFCSHCGSEQLVYEIPEDDLRFRYCCRQCGTVHYQNPKLVVGCLPVYQDKILLCKRAIEPRYGYWNLPAGYLENGETVEQCAIRETWEEARAHVKIIRLHCLYNLPHVNQVYLHFLARLETPDFACGKESLEVKLLPEHEIPWNSLAFSSSNFALQKYVQHKQTYKGVHIGTHFPR